VTTVIEVHLLAAALTLVGLLGVLLFRARSERRASEDGTLSRATTRRLAWALAGGLLVLGGLGIAWVLV
jgi:hypothetical protein